jgi:hypothetical protein
MSLEPRQASLLLDSYSTLGKAEDVYYFPLRAQTSACFNAEFHLLSCHTFHPLNFCFVSLPG